MAAGLTGFGQPCFLYNENPALGAGGSEALIAIKQDKKTPFDVIKRGLATAQYIKRRPAKQKMCLVGKKRITQETQKKKGKVKKT